ncbi:hypothetical protein BN1047_02393 [Mycolicibacterium neoaurum]|uniref:Secreted protein n=1 Tax=Mycolicibacterium neoaurum TaxID=1795 RepID=A0AAV2WL66_MYCNE|nr:hypothetical protein BN1047_02393 [Mycolicibacterium neoaurum]
MATDTVLPAIASAPAVLAATPPPPLALPDMPGLPVQLPASIPFPSDLLCEGTAWSATTESTQDVIPSTPDAVRTDW